MASQNPLLNIRKAKKPADVRAEQVDRDRKLALAFVELGEARGAGAVVVRESGLPRRVVYRAIERQLAWARQEFRHKNGATTDTATPATSDQPEAEPQLSEDTAHRGVA